jgi:hypothetical protein
MTKETTDIFGRSYMYITRAQAEHLENLRIHSFSSMISADDAEKECYEIIFGKEYDNKNESITGVIKRIQHIDSGIFWIANHSKKTLTYDGIRSFRLAEQLKFYFTDEYPCLISMDEYRNIIKHYSKTYGTFFHRPNNKISPMEAEYAEETLRLYQEQILNERRSRKPEFGDVVRCTNGNLGRYVGENQALYIRPFNGDVETDSIDFDIDWENSKDDNLPTDTHLVNYVKKNIWEK